jgi:hypothetical protein
VEKVKHKVSLFTGIAKQQEATSNSSKVQSTGVQANSTICYSATAILHA